MKPRCPVGMRVERHSPGTDMEVYHRIVWHDRRSGDYGCSCGHTGRTRRDN